MWWVQVEEGAGGLMSKQWEVCTLPLGPLGFEGAQHRQTLRPTVDGVRSKALRPFGSQ